MSSRFLKKVANIYGNDQADNANLNESSSDDNASCSFKNKFSLLSDNLTESEQEELPTQAIHIDNVTTKNRKSLQKNKMNGKKKKSSNKYKDMTELEMMDMYNSMAVKPVCEDNSKIQINSLALKVRNLNENAELQHLFGLSDEARGPENDRIRQRHQNPTQKCTFGKRNVNWPNLSFSKLGLAMELIENAKKDSKWCVITCTKEYLLADMALKTSMRTGNFQDHLRLYPYHVNTLLQMAELLTNQEDYTMAADIYKRIFYVYETITPLGLSLLGSNSSGILSKGQISLDYCHRLNRGIFIALFQWIQFLCRKSCFKTALEYCKILLSINIDYDPLAIVLLIDDVAIRGDQYDFLIQFNNQFRIRKSLQNLPNFAFSMAICYFFRHLQTKKHQSDLMTSNELLQNALCLFPTFLMSFAEHCNIQMDERFKQSPFFSKNDDPASLNSLIQLYVKRSLNFWKNTSVLSWVETNANSVLDKLQSNPDDIEKDRNHVIDMYKREIPLAIRRHFALSGYGELTNQLDGTRLYLAFDPFPPVNSEGGFDHYLDNDTELELNGSWFINFLRSFSPSFGV